MEELNPTSHPELYDARLVEAWTNADLLETEQEALEKTIQELGDPTAESLIYNLTLVRVGGGDDP